MNLVRLFIAALLLLASRQSLALFMPDGFQIDTVTTGVPDNDGC